MIFNVLWMDENMSPTITVSFNEFYKMAGEFFKLAQTTNSEETENGFKLLTLAYIGLGFKERLTNVQEVSADAILHLAGSALLRNAAQSNNQK